MILTCFQVFAADGFREFKFGESPETIQEVGLKLCRFGKVTQHTRWEWIKRLDCTGYKFKGAIKARLFFEFSEDELVKIYVVSKHIEDYFLIRDPEFNYRVTLKPALKKSGSTNLVDNLLFKDKVHRLGDEYRYTTFFYQGNWEWEYMYERKGNRDDERRRRTDLLDDEEESGVSGWDKFDFGEVEADIKSKLEGMCSNISVTSNGDLDSITCDDFVFSGEKIRVIFLLDQAGLGKIELQLTSEWYAKLLPLLKRKYGLPFLELKKNNYYYPAIEFPKANVVMAYKRDNSDAQQVWLTLKYMRQDYEDKDQTNFRKKAKDGPDAIPRTKSEQLMDSI